MSWPEPDMETLPCGCRLGSVEDVLVFEGCSRDCEWVAYVLAQSKAHGQATYIADKREGSP